MKEEASIAHERVLDPYLTWAGLTRGRYLARGPAGPWRLALRSRGQVAGRRPIEGLELVSGPIDGLDLLSADFSRLTQRGFAELQARFDFVLAEPGMRSVAVAPLATDPVTGRGRNVKGRSSGVVIGVIDGPCGFANAKFCTGNDTASTRIDHFWDQGSPPASPWLRTVPYGRELDRLAITRQLRRFASGQRLAACGTRAAAEEALYEHLGHALPEDADWSHGTLVLDTVLSEFDARCRASGADRSAASVVYVQLARKALRDTSGRWTASYLHDALQYVVARAADDAHVVVNISLGAFGGPHDGSSMIERAIDRWVDCRPGSRTVVVAAGNAREVRDDATGEVKVCNARRRLEPGAGTTLVWDIDAVDKTESFMEICLPKRRQGDPGLPAIDVQVEAPDGRRLVAGAGGLAAMTDDAGVVVAALINATGAHVAPNGDRGLVLLALGHTCESFGPRAPRGHWKVTVTNRSATAIDIDACVERRDVPGELRGERPQYGWIDEPKGTLPAGSLGSLSSGARTIVVGAVDEPRPGDASFEMSDYSSTGRPGQRRVDMYCVGKRDGTGFLSGSHKELQGTSIAAARATAAAAFVVLTHRSRKIERGPLLAALRGMASSGRAGGRGPSRVEPGAAPQVEGQPGFVLPPP